MEKNKKFFQIELKDTLDRAQVFLAHPAKQDITLAVLYSKQNSGMEVQYESKHKAIINKEVSIRLSRKLDDSMFSKVFFNLENFEDMGNDYRSKFLDINDTYKSNLLMFMSERLDLRSETANSDKDHSNYLMITGWKLLDNESDLIFYFVQRKFFNVYSRTKIVRTLGIQLNTEKGFKILENYYDEFSKNLANKM